MKKIHLLSLLFMATFWSCNKSQQTKETAPIDFQILKSEILAIHQASIDAHLNNDAEYFAKSNSDDYVVVSRAEILRPTPEQIVK